MTKHIPVPNFIVDFQMSVAAIEKMPRFDLGLKEIDEQFWAVLKLPEDREI